MSKNTPVFIFQSLAVMRGGLTKAVLTRANMLSEKLGEVVFITLRYQPNFERIVETLYETGRLSKKVKVINPFFDLSRVKGKSKSRRIKKKESLFIEEQSFDVFKDVNQKSPSYRYYLDGLYLKYKRFDKNENVEFIDYMNESRHRYRRDEFNKNGFLLRSRHMDLITNKPRLDQYFDVNNKCYLTVWVNPNGGERRTIHFTKNAKEYDSLQLFLTNWVDEVIKKYKNPVVISDARPTDTLVRKLENATKKIAVLHNNHYKKPFDNQSEVRESWNPLCNHISSFDALVFLTQEQKRDFISKYGEQSNYKVIPHAAEKVELSNVSYDPYLAVTLARYNAQKRLDEAIKAFYYVVKAIPNAQYHIYGFGRLKEELTNTIEELQLSENVILKGFTDDSQKIYESATCSILTSDFEGFGLVLTESLASGTPVVAYDIKYGPKDIIRDGIDGYLISKGNKKEMATKIIEIMKDPKLRQMLSNNGLEVVDRFSEEKYKERWISLFVNI